MMCLTQRMVLGVTVPGILLALVPTSWGQGCCCGGMNPAMLQNLQIQLMQRQYALQQQNSQTGILQNTINQLATQSESAVRASLKDEQVLVRLSAAYVAGEKRLSLQDDLIKMLTDKNGTIRQVARLSLVKLSMTTTPTTPAKKGSKTACRGVDFGPLPNAGRSAQVKAAKQWRDWWDKKK